MIELSNNEAASLIKLAARGVGYPWGLVEEAAHVSRWLVDRQLPALELFSALFARVDERQLTDFALRDDFNLQADNKACRSSGDELCPLICGSALIDSASVLGVDQVEMHNVICPMLLMPFVSEVSVVLEKPVRMKWNGAELIFKGTCIKPVSDCGELLENGIGTDSPVSISISLISDPLDSELVSADSDSVLDDAHSDELWPIVCNSRVNTEQAFLRSLKQFAHRTYAPATEQSRLSGAGAGTSDND